MSDLSSDSLVALWSSQSEMLWSRLKTASVLQAAFASGWFYLEGKNNSCLQIPLFILILLLMFILLRIAQRDIAHLRATEKKLRGQFPKPPKVKFGGTCMILLGLALLAIADTMLLLSKFVCLDSAQTGQM